jgi:phosphoribosylformimino-5-aminoimidazole carboxamide ribonucleotide (ProFAR) isomerase
MSQVSNTTSSIYLPGLTTTINAAVTQGLQTGITAEAIASGGVSSMFMPLETRTSY